MNEMYSFSNTCRAFSTLRYQSRSGSRFEVRRTKWANSDGETGLLSSGRRFGSAWESMADLQQGKEVSPPPGALASISRGPKRYHRALAHCIFVREFNFRPT